MLSHIVQIDFFVFYIEFMYVSLDRVVFMTLHRVISKYGAVKKYTHFNCVYHFILQHLSTPKFVEENTC